MKRDFIKYVLKKHTTLQNGYKKNCIITEEGKDEKIYQINFILLKWTLGVGVEINSSAVCIIVIYFGLPLNKNKRIYFA